MNSTSFFPRAGTLSLGEVAGFFGLSLPEGADPALRIEGLAALENAGPNDLAYMDNPKYVAALQATRAGACLVSQRFSAHVPAATAALVTPYPYHLFAKAMQFAYPSAIKPASMFGAGAGVAPGAVVHPSARLEERVTVDPGVVIGADVEIGADTVVCANAVIGPGVKIGRGCAVGSGATIQCALIGNRVIIHPGVRIGQDGFGFALNPKGGHIKVPQIGRVIIQDDVEIGANTTIDRGASRDTIIGEGTKIDNLVQIGHNVVIGRNCVIIAQVGISGSTVLEDFVILAGQAGVTGHLTIGAGAQIAAQSGLMHDVPAGAKWGGSPARPARQWLRETAMIVRLTSKGGAAGD